ncbi:MAG TPA: DUF2950 domain-containing protein [Acetobacteraceae bacterium]|jgi:hypothetical protein|nr:DUF2950 domain-containing protein [Acetobacteraceae bacterium]
MEFSIMKVMSVTLRAIILAGLLVGGTLPFPAFGAPSQLSFATPDDAVAALLDAARSNDPKQLLAVLGSGSETLINSGDQNADAAARQKFVADYDAQHKLAEVTPGHDVLRVGANDWPMPIPVVLVNGRWQFDTQAGAQEIIDRRIGRNEIAAIRVALTYVDAQRDYFERTKQASGKGEYAQRLASRPNKHDGLYWPVTTGEPESPFGPLVAQSVEEGYPDDPGTGYRIPYQGYYFRILNAQGENAPGGAKSYVTGGRMTEGFALVAWPASFGASGIMTFLVDQDGVVYQKDLGSGTAAIAAAMARYNPDITWARVDVTSN